MNRSIFAMLLLAGSAVGQAPGQPLGQDQPADAGRVHTDPAPFPRNPFQPDLTPGYVLYQGDIQVRLDQYLSLMAGYGTNATFGNVPNYWTTQIVPYDFVTTGVGAVSAANQTAAINAMALIAARVNLTFRPANGLEDRVRFQNSTFNNSPIGRQGGPQIINIANWSLPLTICHEVYHSLGFWHEQTRSDRDTYVTINLADICGSSTTIMNGCNAQVCCLCVDGNNNCVPCAFNFDLSPGTSHVGPYDFASIMHYGRSAFSCTGNDTITVRPPWNAQWQSLIGNYSQISYYDAVVCRGLYPYPNDRWVDSTWGGSQGGTMLLPWNLSFAGALSLTPPGGSLFIKNSGNYSAIGVHSHPATIDAPGGPVILGN